MAGPEAPPFNPTGQSVAEPNTRCLPQKVSIYLPMLSPQQLRGFGALADPTRRAVLEGLARGPRPVGELARGLPVSRPAVSQHLRALKEAGLVSESRTGRRRLYKVELRAIEALSGYFDQFWTAALEGMRAATPADTPPLHERGEGDGG